MNPQLHPAQRAGAFDDVTDGRLGLTAQRLGHIENVTELTFGARPVRDTMSAWWVGSLDAPRRSEG